jgi:tRNA(adenine34) deaminase
VNHFNRLIKIAIKKAKQNLNSQDFPIACILVLQDKKTNKIKHLTLAKNKVYNTGNCLMHAECLAIGEMCIKIKNSRFDDYFSTLYSTLEPCLMCYGAICHARIDRLVFGLKDGKFGFTSHVKNFHDGALQDKINSNNSKSGYSHPEVFYGFCEEEIAKLLQNFTLNLR